jgi:hypothetical protein
MPGVVTAVIVDSVRPPISPTPRERRNPTRESRRNPSTSVPLQEPVVVDSIRPDLNSTLEKVE